MDVKALAGVIMGSTSDWETMQHTCAVLEEFEIPYEKRVISAHRAPEALAEYVKLARPRGVEVLIGGAGGAAHLPGVMAAYTSLPVIGVPMQSKTLNGLDSLLSIVQMPAGVPVATVAIGRAGATNAGLLAVQILALHRPALIEKLEEYRKQQTQKVLAATLP